MRRSKTKIPPFSLQEQNGAYLLQVVDLLVEVDNRAILPDIQEQLPPRKPNVMVDIRHLDYVNSVGLSFLLSLYKSTQMVSGRMIILTAMQPVIDLIAMTKLDSILHHRPTVEAALTQFTTWQEEAERQRNVT